MEQVLIATNLYVHNQTNHIIFVNIVWLVDCGRTESGNSGKVKVFCTKENIEKLHTEISGFAVPAIEEKVMDTAMNEITENVSVKKQKQDSVPAEKNVIVEERSPEPAPVINEPVKSVQKKQTLFEQLK